jgi:translocator protein
MYKRPFIIFPFLTLLLGQLSGGISFILFPFNPASTGYTNPPVFPSPAMFTFVWVILYACMGISIAYIWNERKRVDIKGVMTSFVWVMIATMLFVPVMILSKGSPGVMTLLDVNGTLAAFLYARLALIYSRKAYGWVIPLLIWMPITTTLKIWMWSIN